MEIVKVANPCKDVRKLREMQGENQTDFWRRFGLTQSAGSRYESGRNIPHPVRTLLEIRYGTKGAKVIAELQS